MYKAWVMDLNFVTQYTKIQCIISTGKTKYSGGHLTSTPGLLWHLIPIWNDILATCLAGCLIVANVPATCLAGWLIVANIWTDSWLHCNDDKMRVVTVDEVRKAQAYILVYVRSHAQPLTATAADSSIMKLPTSSVPRFSEMHRRSSEDARMSLKRRKTTVWW